MVTLIDFRLFFDSLPQADEQQFAATGLLLPDQARFAQRCQLPLEVLQQLAVGKQSFSAKVTDQLLPVMRKYGFAG